MLRRILPIALLLTACQAYVVPPTVVPTAPSVPPSVSSAPSSPTVGGSDALSRTVQIAVLTTAPGAGIACGYARCALVDRTVADDGAPLRAAVRELLTWRADPAQTVLINEFSGSDLRVESADIANGVATVRLTGRAVPVGDMPNMDWQLEATARQFPEVREVRVFLNGSEKAWDSVFDLRGTVRTAQVALTAETDVQRLGKKFGCDSYIVFVEREVPDDGGPLKAALAALLALKDDEVRVQGFHNAYSDSGLRLDGVTLVDGVATVKLSGQPRIGGTCDSPRMPRQIEETAKRFPTVRSVKILLDGSEAKWNALFDERG